MPLDKPRSLNIKTRPPIQGRRQAFRYIKREIPESDLSSPSIMKLILNELERTESDYAYCRSYIERFHKADKRAAVYKERTKTIKAIEVLFQISSNLGCLLLGLTAGLWNSQPFGWLSLSIGTLLFVGTYLARIIKG